MKCSLKQRTGQQIDGKVDKIVENEPFKSGHYSRSCRIISTFASRNLNGEYFVHFQSQKTLDRLIRATSSFNF